MPTQEVPSSNAKLAVFRNLDIMDTVFDALLVKYDADAGERKHLFQAALTAKNFYDPAMNILWRSLDSLLPVLKLIPGFQELIDPTVEDSEYYTTTKAISEEDLVRVDCYCRRVRHLTLLCNPGTLRPRISAHIYSSLSEFRRFGLFPALRWLNIDLDELLPDDLHLYGLLLLPTPTLSHVLCSGIGHLSEVHVATFLTRLSRIKTQSLQHLSLRGKLSSNILDTLPRSSKVTSLDLDINKMIIPVENMVAAISHLTALRRLGLTFWNHDNMDFRTHFGSTAAPVTIVPFDQLKELQIDAYDARQLCTFLVTAVKHMPILKRLTINFELDDEDEAAGDDS